MEPLATCSYLNLSKIKFEIQFLGCTNRVSSAPQLHVASGISPSLKMELEGILGVSYFTQVKMDNHCSYSEGTLCSKELVASVDEQSCVFDGYLFDSWRVLRNCHKRQGPLHTVRFSVRWLDQAVRC